MAAFDSPVPKQLDTMVNPPISNKSFAQALTGGVSDTANGETFRLPPTMVMGSSVHVRISKAAYEFRLVACKTHLHGRLTLHKGDTPITTQALKAKLTKNWPHFQNWNLTPLGKGFFEFNFNSIEKCKVSGLLEQSISNLDSCVSTAGQRILLHMLRLKLMRKFG